MYSLSSLDVHYLVKELQSVIEDSFVDKIYQSDLEKGEFLIRMRSPAAGKQQLYIQAPEAVFLTEHRYPWPKEPLGFCMQLRKHLSNSKLATVEQHAFERIIILTFQKGPVSWKLILELFSKGNVVLVNSDGLIRGVLDLQRWKDRTLRVNAPYEFPPEKADTTTLSVEQLLELFNAQEKDVVKFCATSLSLGGKYAEELLSRTNLDKHATELTETDVIMLHQALQELLNLEPSPSTCDGDAAPFVLSAWNDDFVISSESFSHAIESLVVGAKHETVEDSQDFVMSSKRDKFQRIIDEQSNKLKGYEQSAVDNQRKGELIYEKYQDLQSLLEQLKALHDTDGWPAVKEFIAEQDIPVSVDEARGTITLDVKD